MLIPEGVGKFNWENLLCKKISDPDLVLDKPPFYF